MILFGFRKKIFLVSFQTPNDIMVEIFDKNKY